MRLRCGVLVTLLGFCDLFYVITASSSSQEIAELPKIFYLNESDDCSNNQLFCKVNVKLKTEKDDAPQGIWDMMKTQLPIEKDSLFRAFCASDENVEEKIQQELDQYNLTGNAEMYCYPKKSVWDSIGTIEILTALFIFVYSCFMIYSTIKTHNPKNKVNKYEQIFSLTNIWKEMNEPKNSEDYSNLLSIQGMRTVAMVAIVGAHTALGMVMLIFIKNPEYYEKFTDSQNAWSILYGSFGLVVHIYFVISAWLLSVQLHNLFKKNGEFTFKDLSLLWLNRYFRLFPSLAFSVIMHSSLAIVVFITHPYFYSIILREAKNCHTSWWKNLLFLQNMQDEGICALGTWYLAADTHLYIISSAIFFISRKYKVSMKYLFGLVAAVAASIQLYNVFTTDFDGVFRFNVRLLPAEETLSTPSLLVSYTRTQCCAGSYIIGFLFGSIYVLNKKKVIFDTKMKEILAVVAFIGFPILASFVVTLRLNRVFEAILAVGVRPLFSLGIAIGLLLMTTGKGGVIKRFFESSPMVFLGNLTYSTYLFHFAAIVARQGWTAKYVELTDFMFVSGWLMDLVTSFAIGLIVYVLLEHPCLKLQKYLIPQIPNRRKEEKQN